VTPFERCGAGADFLFSRRQDRSLSLINDLEIVLEPRGPSGLSLFLRSKERFVTWVERCGAEGVFFFLRRRKYSLSPISDLRIVLKPRRPRGRALFTFKITFLGRGPSNAVGPEPSSFFFFTREAQRGVIRTSFVADVIWRMFYGGPRRRGRFGSTRVI
jgi:hypothetical protein